MPQMTFRESLGLAMSEEMERDAEIFLMGEEVAEYDGAYKVSKGLLEKFGPKRVWDSPISENGFAGLSVGAAMAGLRPIIEMMTWNFGLQAVDQIINHAAKMRYMSGGQFRMPITFRGPNGAAHMLGAQHSQAVEPIFTNIPGLKVVCPADPADGKGLLKSSIRDDNPVIFLESEMMYGRKMDVSDDPEWVIPLGEGVIKRAGKDATLVAWGKVLHVAMEAAEQLSADGIEVEVFDPRTLQPLDEATLFASVRKTHRCVIAEESWSFASVGAQISDRVQSQCFDDLDAPTARVTTDFVPMPYAEHLEHEVVVTPDKIVKAVRDACYQ